MTQFVTRRFVHSLTALFGVVTIMFFLLHVTGDPVVLLAPMDATQEVVNTLRNEYGLDQPLFIQYLHFLNRVLRGDLGYSYRQSLPVLELLVERIPATIELALAGVTVAILLGIPLGMVAATRRGSILDALAMLLSLIGMSIPSFWLGLIFIIIFGVFLGWLPISGFGGLRHLIMPSLVLGGFYAAQVARLTRTSLLEVLAQEYMRTAKAKGLAEHVVLLKHGMRNAAIPLLTMTGLSFGRMLGGAVVVESIFAWPGMGRLAVQAVLGRDFPIVQGAVILGSLVFLSVNFAVDLFYGWIDPRIRMGT